MLGRELGPGLLGHHVKELRVSQGEGALGFLLDNGQVVVWDTAGDCCSESWWADGFSLNALEGVVEEVIELKLPAPDDGRTRQEEDEAYGFKIVTNRGKAQLVFRNSSNGYYGGWASEAFADPERIAGWRLIDGNDWRA